jgi:endonuclease III
LGGGEGNVMPIDIDKLVADLERAYADFREPLVTAMAKRQLDPFKALIATLLSLRTRDEQTEEASKRLFKLADSPYSMLKLAPQTIEKAIFPVGFYRVKALRILEVCGLLVHRHAGQVPADLETLLALPGVGRKTANLVLTRGFELPGICVDTHVHRISNRLGYVQTEKPDQTELALRRKLPDRYWIIWNDLLVAYGQNICTPISPRCSQCVVVDQCEQVGVGKRR